MKYSCEELVRKMNMKPLKLLRLSVYPLKENIRKNNKIINKVNNILEEINEEVVRIKRWLHL